ncbi:hypothetical protein [Streptomyces sp. CA-253872]|uniref:hypothetical protein n=1 Tax=Streptomyces sp. CA-253872 TaxID=3240067 RepID=UPI003D9237C8
MTAGLRAVTAPAASLVLLLALVLVLLLPDGLAYAMGRTPRALPHGTASPAPLRPFAEPSRPLTGLEAAQSHLPAPAPPPEHPGPSPSDTPQPPAAVPPFAPDPSTAPALPPFPGTGFPVLPTAPSPTAPGSTPAAASPSDTPHRPESPSPSVASAVPSGETDGADASVLPSRTGHGAPPKEPRPPAASHAPFVVPAPPSRLPLTPSTPRRSRAPLAPLAQSPEGERAGAEALAEEMPSADEIPFRVGASGTGVLTDARGRLVLGGGLICLGCGLATALLALRLRRA